MDPVLKLDNDPIQFVKEAKFLGLVWGADQTTFLKLYRSLVRSKLDYGCIVYGSASKTALAQLDPVHNQGLHLSLGAFRSSPVESLCVEAHEPPLEIRREKLALQYILKLKANPGNPAYDVVFNPKYQILYADKESATDYFGIHCKKLLKKAKMLGKLLSIVFLVFPFGILNQLLLILLYPNLTSHLLLLLFLKVDLMR